MRITDLILICIYFIWNLSSVSCLFFHIGETERKCFIEEVPEDTIVNINYKVELYDPKTGGFMQPTLGIGMHVEVKDPDGTTVLSRVYSMEGKVSFTSNLAGEHSLCLYSNATKWFGGSQLRIHLNIEVGEHDLSENMLPQKEKLNDLQKKLLHLLQQVDQISSEQNYQRFREEKFRQLSESTNSRVLWWSLLQIILLIAMGAWQMRHLKGFFEAKKLV